MFTDEVNIFVLISKNKYKMLPANPVNMKSLYPDIPIKCTATINICSAISSIKSAIDTIK